MVKKRRGRSIVELFTMKLDPLGPLHQILSTANLLVPESRSQLLFWVSSSF